MKLTLLFAFELLKEITLELLKLLVLILFFHWNFFFLGGGEAGVYFYLAYKTSDAS